MKSSKKKYKTLFVIGVFLAIYFIDYYQEEIVSSLNTGVSYSYNLDNIPEYNGENYVIINDNNPVFDDEYKTEVSFEMYSELDYLGRCGEAFANVSLDTMPDGPRGSIGSVKPTGWQTVKYDIVDGKYLYNRCHLIG